MNPLIPIEISAAEAASPQTHETRVQSPEQGSAFDLMLTQLMQAIVSLPVQTEVPDAAPALQAEEVLPDEVQKDAASEGAGSMPPQSELQTIQSAFAAVIADVLDGAAQKTEAHSGRAVRKEEAILQDSLSSLISENTDAAADEVIAPALTDRPDSREARMSGQKNAQPFQVPADGIKKTLALDEAHPQLMREVILAEGSTQDRADLPEPLNQRVKAEPATLPMNSAVPPGIARIHPDAAEGTAALVRPQQFSGTMHLEGNRLMITRLDGTSIGISLQPEGIGKLEIGLMLDKGVVNAQIQASNAAGKELIEKHMHDIVQALAQEGITIGGFSVSLRDDRNDLSWAQDNGQADQVRSEPVPVHEYISTPRQFIDRSGVSIFV